MRERLPDEREPDELLRERPDDARPLLLEPVELLRLRAGLFRAELLRVELLLVEPPRLRELDLRDDDELDLRADEDDLRADDELDLREDDEARRRPPFLRRSAAGISSCATAFVSCGMSFSRNFAMRSSSRRMPRAIFAVSLSPTVSASVSIDV